MYCANCGNEVKPGSSFCGNCGNIVNTKEPENINKEPIIAQALGDKVQNNKKSHKTQIIILASVFSFIIIGALAYYYFKSEEESRQKNNRINIEEFIDEPSTESESVPVEVYEEDIVNSKETTTHNTYREVGIINDPDGYSNLRELPDVSSQVISEVYDKEEFEILNKSGDWWLVSTTKKITGYMHYSRIKIIHQTIYGNYPESSTRYLSREELKILNSQQLRIMRNEIFARYGYVFKSNDLSMHFENCDWYLNLNKLDANNDASSLLTETESANIKLIQEIEKTKE